MTDFTPWSSLAGGALIGVAAVLLLSLDGRIAGVSGIAGALVERSSSGDRLWRLLFLAGLALGAAAAAALGAPSAPPREGHGALPLVVAGLLTGYGTSLGGGCTSGHGVCGLALFSRRSFVAVIVFMAVAIGTVFVLRHVAGAR